MMNSTYRRHDPQRQLSNLGRAVTGRTFSVVNTLMGRELGFPKFVRSSEKIGSGTIEKTIGRQLIKARSKESSTSKTALPVLLKDYHVNKKSNTREPVEWMMISLERNERLLVADYVLWEVTNKISSGAKVYTERLFELQPDPAKRFQLVKQVNSYGRMQDYEVCFCSTHVVDSIKSSFFLITLTETGCLQAFDAKEKSGISRLNLRPRPTLENTPRFTSMEFDATNSRIFVIASRSGLLKSLYCIRYPPWCIENIIHVDFSVRIEMYESALVILSPNHIEIVDVEKVIQAAEETEILVSESQKDGNPKCKFWPGVYEKVWRKKTEVLTKIQTNNTFFGILDCVWPPVFYAKTNNNIRIGRFNDNVSLWEINTNRFSIGGFSSLPDGSPNLLFLTEDDYRVVTLKKTENTSPVSLEFSTSQPFRHEDSPPLNNWNRPRLNPRPMRSTASKINYSVAGGAAINVIGVAYNHIHQLIAVFSAGPEDLYVSLYEAHTLNFFKKLPPVKAWPDGSWKQRRGISSDDCSPKEAYMKLSIEMEFDYIYVCVKYPAESEVFILRLLNDQ